MSSSVDLLSKSFASKTPVISSLLPSITGNLEWPEDTTFFITSSTSSLISKTIKTNSRSFVIDRCSANVALCSFNLLCASNLAHEDYKNVAESFSLIFISGIPELTNDKIDQCRRFISLIDMLYNQNCSTVLLAQNPISSLCKIPSLSKEFKRTASRLYEMTIIQPS